jgi:hypothetical protein
MSICPKPKIYKEQGRWFVVCPVLATVYKSGGIIIGPFEDWSTARTQAWYFTMQIGDQLKSMAMHAPVN